MTLITIRRTRGADVVFLPDPVVARAVDWLPADGAWQEGQRGRTSREEEAILAALDALHGKGLVQTRPGRMTKYGRQLIEWRLTATGIAYKLEQERKGRRN